MNVCCTLSMDTEIPVIAFGKGETKNPNAFVVTNMNSDNDKPVVINVEGCSAAKFKAFRTTEDESDLYEEIGEFEMENGQIYYDAPKGSVTTFFAEI